MQTVIFILRTIQKKGSLIIKGNSSISISNQLIIVISTIELFSSKLRHQFFEVLLAYVTQQQIIKRFDICVRTISYDIYCSLWAKDVFNRCKQFPSLRGSSAQTFNLHDLIEFLLNFEVSDRVFFEGALLSHVYDYTDYLHTLFEIIQQYFLYDSHTPHTLHTSGLSPIQ